MKKLLLLLPLLGGCASLADLREWEARSQQDLAEFKAGTITEEEYLQREANNRSELVNATEAKIDAVLGKVESGPITGNPLADLILGSAGAAAAAYFGVNKHRDTKRKQLGPDYKP